MHDQLVCHVEFASTKGAWYLEPARPDVGYAATVAAAKRAQKLLDTDNTLFAQMSALDLEALPQLDLMATNPFLYVFNADKAGRPMAHYPAKGYTLSDGQLLLMSDHSPLSFDARYFGPVSESQIRGVIRPVLTW